MDIDLLSKMVKEIILDNDRVVLPGLGCFVAEIVPAYFSDKGYTINPPYRKLYFRARPDEGDAIVQFYAKSNDVAYEVAEKIIKDFVAELKAVLHVKKVVVFPGLGRLRATKENNIFFIADEDLDIYPEGIGLEPISLKTHKETHAEVSAFVGGLKDILAEPTLEPEPTPEPEPIPEPVFEVEPIVEPIVEPAVEPTDEPIIELAEVEPAAEPETEPVPPPAEPDPAPAVVPAPAKKSAAGKILLIILAVFVLLVAAYMAVGRLCPEWLDTFLYTPEELEIINR